MNILIIIVTYILVNLFDDGKNRIFLFISKITDDISVCDGI